MKRLLHIFLIFTILTTLIFIDFFVSDYDTTTRIFPIDVRINIAYAGLGKDERQCWTDSDDRDKFKCQVRRMTQRIWERFLKKGDIDKVGDKYSKQGALSDHSGVFTPFGGRVLAMLPCTCVPPLTTYAFIIEPFGGEAGVYNVNALPLNWALKKWYAILPGNAVLGNSVEQKTPCYLGIAPICWKFDTDYYITPPPAGSGMGTGLIPF
jgi:hypothetical protein